MSCPSSYGRNAAVSHSEKLRIFESIPWAELPQATLSEQECGMLGQLLRGKSATGVPLFTLTEAPHPTSDIEVHRQFMFDDLLQREIISDRCEFVEWIVCTLLQEAEKSRCYEYFKNLLQEVLSIMVLNHPNLQSLLLKLTSQAATGFQLQQELLPCKCSPTTKRTVWRLVSSENVPTALPFSSSPNSPSSEKKYCLKATSLYQKLMQEA
jgi:hypothetical protein